MNNKIKLLGVTLVSVMAVAATGVGFAFAQTATLPATPVPTTGYGTNMMGGYGQAGYGTSMMGGQGGMMGGFAQNGTTWAAMDAMHQWMTTSGGMHTFVWNALAEQLGLSSDKLTAAVNSGKTVVQIAQEKGFSPADLVAALDSAHRQSLAQAVTAGVLTQAQADSLASQMAGRYDWMLDHMGQGGMASSRYGAGGCHGNRSGNSAAAAPKP